MCNAYTDRHSDTRILTHDRVDARTPSHGNNYYKFRCSKRAAHMWWCVRESAFVSVCEYRSGAGRCPGFTPTISNVVGLPLAAQYSCN